MATLTVSMFLSLDGVMENPAWTAPYWGDDIAKFKAYEGEGIGALLLGRVTYEGFAQAWPTSTDEGAPWFNNIRKYVVTNSLTNLEWNNSVVVKGDLTKEITRLKQEQNLLLYGSGALVKSLMELNLVDKFSLLIYPVVLGTGRKLFAEGVEAKLNLLESKTYASGAVSMIYETIK